jgi:hypothetical protein
MQGEPYVAGVSMRDSDLRKWKYHQHSPSLYARERDDYNAAPFVDFVVCRDQYSVATPQPPSV